MSQEEREQQQKILDLKFFQTQNFFWAQIFFTLKIFFGSNIFFRPKIFSNPKFFQSQIFLDLIFFSDQIFFLTHNNSDPKRCLEGENKASELSKLAKDKGFT